MELLRFIFWRFLRQPAPGERWVYREAERGAEPGHAIVEIIDVRDKKVLRQWESLGTDITSVQNMVAFWRPL